jgi:hypothetical protein
MWQFIPKPKTGKHLKTAIKNSKEFHTSQETDTRLDAALGSPENLQHYTDCVDGARAGWRDPLGALILALALTGCAAQSEVDSLREQVSELSSQLRDARVLAAAGEIGESRCGQMVVVGSYGESAQRALIATGLCRAKNIDIGSEVAHR